MAPLDNVAIARILGEIGDLLELKGENPFKIRAYRNAADLLAASTDAVAGLDAKGLQQWPGIGKDLSARIIDICQTGTCAIHQELLASFPATLLDLLRLQGVGPKTVALLYGELRIASLEDLETAAKTGRLRELKGMGPRREQLLLRALEEGKQHAHRHLLADAAETATRLVEYLATEAPGVSFETVGSVRRGTETCGDIDILALGAAPELMAVFTAYPLVERVLGHGETKSSVLIRGGYQADLRLVAADSRGAALQYFTGSKSHNIALRDRALERGLRLNEYGLFRASDEQRLAGDTEASIYEALDMAWVPPELREHRGEIALAAARQLPRLVEWSDLRGDLHMHTTETDGRDDLEAMVQAAREAGLDYIAITDHSKALAMANGLDETRALAHAARIRDLNARMAGIEVLAGIECDILPDGTLDLAADCLAQLDLVVASVHSAHRQEEAEMTQRLLRAIEHPWVDIVAHPTGRVLLRREPSRVNLEQVARAAAAHGVALEINCHPDRLDLSDVNARLVRERGVRLVISSDAHSRQALANKRWGVLVARRAWTRKEDVLNTLPFAEFRQSLRRHRSRSSRAGGSDESSHA
ncbi:MAG TPA: DNA polymerase/3'-5' exonuclease PolX [Vicinamibacterales bacterium]|nr:DNA polymerase/3'-5' exonuclease PolX [Vicinamibacterales bacterium]